MRLDRFLIFPALWILSGCSTLAGGQMQNITINVLGAPESHCLLDNGVKYRVRANETIEIMRSQSDLEVECFASGNRYKKFTVPSGISDWAAANVLNGVIPGVSYDHFSKGLYDYPPKITVDFTGMPTTGYELPEYHNKDAPNPYDQAIEPYGPSTVRVPKDNTYMKRGVEKRDPNENTNPFSTGAPKDAPMTDMPAPMATPTPAAPVPKGSTAEELNRSMNPHVFNR
jgi:hypothetical protein